MAIFVRLPDEPLLESVHILVVYIEYKNTLLYRHYIGQDVNEMAQPLKWMSKFMPW